MPRVADIDPETIEYCEFCEDAGRKGVVATSYLQGVPACQSCFTLGPKHPRAPEPTIERAVVTQSKCRCGCGETVKDGKSYKHGHGHRARGGREWGNIVPSLAALADNESRLLDVPEGEIAVAWMNALRCILGMRKETIHSKWTVKTGSNGQVEVTKLPREGTTTVAHHRESETTIVKHEPSDDGPQMSAIVEQHDQQLDSIEAQLTLVHGEIVELADQISAAVSKRKNAVTSPESREINFPQGGRILVTIDANFLLLDEAERKFLIQLCKLLDAYENCKASAVMVIDESITADYADAMWSDCMDTPDKLAAVNHWLSIDTKKPKEIQTK
jgi:hypothetical protein